MTGLKLRNHLSINYWSIVCTKNDLITLKFVEINYTTSNLKFRPKILKATGNFGSENGMDSVNCMSNYINFISNQLLIDCVSDLFMFNCVTIKHKYQLFIWLNKR